MHIWFGRLPLHKCHCSLVGHRLHTDLQLEVIKQMIWEISIMIPIKMDQASKSSDWVHNVHKRLMSNFEYNYKRQIIMCGAAVGSDGVVKV